LSTDPNYQRRFQHEANIATGIDSPYLPRVYDVGRVGETFYIAMELIRGWSLARVVDDLAAKGQRPSIESSVEAIAEDYEGKASVFKMNVDENMNVPQRYGIRGIPTLIVFKGGQEQERIVGAVSREAIANVIEKYV
jgi:hypothetical protein